MTARRLGHRSLRWDALYCLLVGAIVALAAPVVADALTLPTPVIVVVGLVVILWAGLVEWMRARIELRVALGVVLGVNLVATLLVAGVSLLATTLIAVAATVAVAVEILVFAGSQMIALRGLRSPAGAQ